MATQAQINANRANAQLSTGPKTPEGEVPVGGKQRSSLNALKHGFRARIVLERTFPCTGEDPDEFDPFLADLVAEMAPVGTLESQFVETIALCLWRQRRVIRSELGWISEDHAFLHDFKTKKQIAENPHYDACCSIPRPNRLDHLLRYETHLDRVMYRALHQFQQLQAARLAQSSHPSSASPVSASPTPSHATPPPAPPNPDPFDAPSSNAKLPIGPNEPNLTTALKTAPENVDAAVGADGSVRPGLGGGHPDATEIPEEATSVLRSRILPNEANLATSLETISEKADAAVGMGAVPAPDKGVLPGRGSVNLNAECSS